MSDRRKMLRWMLDMATLPSPEDAQIERLRAENDRLRALLVDARDQFDRGTMLIDGIRINPDWHRMMVRIDAALKGTPDVKA